MADSDSPEIQSFDKFETFTTNAAAASFLRTLARGAKVVYRRDGRNLLMTVSRTYQRADHPFGDPNGGNVVLTLGPGRYSATVSTGSLVAKYALIASWSVA